MVIRPGQMDPSRVVMAFCQTQLHDAVGKWLAGDKLNKVAKDFNVTPGSIRRFAREYESIAYQNRMRQIWNEVDWETGRKIICDILSGRSLKAIAARHRDVATEAIYDLMLLVRYRGLKIDSLPQEDPEVSIFEYLRTFKPDKEDFMQQTYDFDLRQNPQIKLPLIFSQVFDLKQKEETPHILTLTLKQPRFRSDWINLGSVKIEAVNRFLNSSPEKANDPSLKTILHEAGLTLSALLRLVIQFRPNEYLARQSFWYEKIIAGDLEAKILAAAEANKDYMQLQKEFAIPVDIIEGIATHDAFLFNELYHKMLNPFPDPEMELNESEDAQTRGKYLSEAETQAMVEEFFEHNVSREELMEKYHVTQHNFNRLMRTRKQTEWSQKSAELRLQKALDVVSSPDQPFASRLNDLRQAISLNREEGMTWPMIAERYHLSVTTLRKLLREEIVSEEPSAAETPDKQEEQEGTVPFKPDFVQSIEATTRISSLKTKIRRYLTQETEEFIKQLDENLCESFELFEGLIVNREAKKHEDTLKIKVIEQSIPGLQEAFDVLSTISWGDLNLKIGSRGREIMDALGTALILMQRELPEDKDAEQTT